MAGMIIAVAVIFSLVANTTEGAHPPIPTSLPDSNFEIDIDANLKVDHAAPYIDWAHPSVVAGHKDELSGSDDDAFGKGTKEDTAVPALVLGSVPPNKSDLKAFGVYLEENDKGKYLHLFWTGSRTPRERPTWISNSTSLKLTPIM